jgi:receptor protein-tyrosine kinase
VPELAAIPSVKHLPSRGPRALSWGGGQSRVERISSEHKESDFSESFRGALVSILSVAEEPNAARTIVVTSPLPMEGKTTVVSNLGITLGQVQRRVLLIDGDRRRPRLHDVFDLSNDWGLSSLLNEKTPIEELPLEALAQPTAVPGVYVLPSGPNREDFAQLLYSGRMEQLMSRMRGEFDHVLIDAPPCLKFADARMLAHYADGVLIVVRANSTYDKSALAAVQRFLADGIPVLGTLLNDWNPRISPAFGYDRYAKHYAVPRAA